MAASKDEARRVAWAHGRLGYLLRRQPKMREAYEAFRADDAREKGRVWYFNISRQFGKSYTCCLLALEECLRQPGAQVKYACIDQKSARSIVFPQMETLLRDCPEELMPTFRVQQGEYYFPHNGSRMTIAGADKDNAKKLRGTKAHLCVIDEAGFVPDLPKIALEVLLPQTTTTKGRMIVATSPADSAGHFATELARQCESRGAYFKFTIDENNLLSEKEKEEIAAEYGGRDATRFRREYLCEFVTDSQNAVVPEWDEAAKADCVVETPRPQYFDALEALDGGYTDPAGLLFAYVDYDRAKLVIEEEWLKKEVLTADIARHVVETEARLWTDSDLFWPDSRRRRQRCRSTLRRVMDIDPEKAADFKANHGLDWTPAQKGPGSLQVSVNLLNSFIRQRSLEIRPNCVNLIRQLHNATWAGRKLEDGTTPRRTFSRNQQDGHFDLVAALIYMLPFVDFGHNPYPEAGHDNSLHYDSAELPDADDTEEALARAFRMGE